MKINKTNIFSTNVIVSKCIYRKDMINYLLSSVSPQPAEGTQVWQFACPILHDTSSIHATGTHKTLERSSLYNKFRSRGQQITRRPSLPPFNNKQHSLRLVDRASFINTLFLFQLDTLLCIKLEKKKSIYSINSLVFITEVESVYSAVRTEPFYNTYISSL